LCGEGGKVAFECCKCLRWVSQAVWDTVKEEPCTFIKENNAFFCPLGTFSISQFVMIGSPDQSMIRILQYKRIMSSMIRRSAVLLSCKVNYQIAYINCRQREIRRTRRRRRYKEDKV
jgi:hypothetical protein